tara:strand:- start:137 stop:376 length:240 start_codon:yes stop_codon:yes gene_type:complete
VSGDFETYEWFETPYGSFRVEKKRFGTWTSYSKDGEELITGGTREAVMSMSPFHLEGVATNWANATSSKPFNGTVSGKL